VVIPCYNYGHYLEGCLDSVLSQEGVDVGVLVIDDRSTDDSAEVARRLAERDHRVELLVHERNAGLIATINDGLRWARGDYVTVVSSDDLLVPGCLARATAIMGRHPEVGLVYGRPTVLREGEPLPAGTGRWRGTDIWSGDEGIRVRCRSGHNCMSSPEAVVRTSVHRAAGLYDPACTHTSDLNMWLRLAAHAKVAYVRGAPQAIYRVHGESMQRTADRWPIVDLQERKTAFDAFFAACEGRLERPAELRRTVGRTLARQALWQASRTIDCGGDDSLVPEFVAFALEACPDARRLSHWRGLRLRRRIGAGWSQLFPPFLATGAAHRLRYHANQVRWRTTGV
jgi:hypothetical protein